MILAVALAVSCDATLAEPATHVVVIEQMRFDPPALTVQPGDRVVWVNKDLFPHTASADRKRSIRTASRRMHRGVMSPAEREVIRTCATSIPRCMAH